MFEHAHACIPEIPFGFYRFQEVLDCGMPVQWRLGFPFLELSAQSGFFGLCIWCGFFVFRSGRFGGVVLPESTDESGAVGFVSKWGGDGSPSRTIPRERGDKPLTAMVTPGSLSYPPNARG